jgi:hypothetical protein
MVVVMEGLAMLSLLLFVRWDFNVTQAKQRSSAGMPANKMLVNNPDRKSAVPQEGRTVKIICFKD